jgi:hypothetical protein
MILGLQKKHHNKKQTEGELGCNPLVFDQRGQEASAAATSSTWRLVAAGAAKQRRALGACRGGGWGACAVGPAAAAEVEPALLAGRF